MHLCDELDNTTGLLDLALGLGADVASLDDDGEGDAALSEELGVSVGEEIEDGSSVGLVGGVEVLLTELDGEERDELVDVDNGLPVVVAEEMEMPHSNLSEVTRMVFVHVGTVMVLTTGETTTTRMLPVFADLFPKVSVKRLRTQEQQYFVPPRQTYTSVTR